MHRRLGTPPVWVIVALIVVLLLSDVPATRAGSRSASPTSATPSVASGPSATPVAASTPAGPHDSLRSETMDPHGHARATLCLLGLQADCSSDASLTASPARPLVTQPSSWTNITPPSGAPNPGPRTIPAEAYYPTGHEVLLFGGADFFLLYQDTWAFSAGHWTEVISNSTCTVTTCPAARAGAMMAYDPALDGMLLFGGLNLSLTFNDTWLFANGSWTNLTSTAGNAPSPRFSGAMTYDPSDNYVLLFGGEGSLDNALADTWKFSDGRWTNLTAGLSPAPSARANAAITDSPDGYVMLYGGLNSYNNGSNSTILFNPCNPSGAEIAWWFYQGKWSSEAGYPTTCIASPLNTSGTAVHPDASIPNQGPPCGREGAALGWSPKNNRFVLYGGYGYTFESGACTFTEAYLNDTWTYDLPAGGGFLWNNASSPPGPPARAYMGYASDFSDNYFEIFGGTNGVAFALNETWRFYEIVYAKLTGPLGYDTGGGLQFKIPFVVLGYGGTGDLAYSFTIKNTRTSNKLTSGVCDWFYNGTSTALPFNGTVDIPCVPTPKTYGVYHIELTVTDEGNGSKPSATANWTFTVTPPEKMVIYSEYAGYFYSNVDFDNTFTIYAEVANDSATSLTATLGGQPITFTQSSHSRWWNATGINMGAYSAGTQLTATAQFSNWTENASTYISVINTPAWLLTLFKATGAKQSVSSQGAGPFNKSYTVTEEYDWNLGNSTNFSIDVPLVGGNYGLIPSVNVTFNATSSGNLSVLGTFSLTPPSIDIGPASLKVTASIQMAGTFQVVVPGVQWVSAQAAVQVSAQLSASIPIYGFSLLGCNIGFTLQLTISPTITLDMILAPLQAGGTQIIQGVAVEVQKFLGSFSLALSAAINFGIGIASIGLGVGLSVAVAFQLNPFSVYAGWVNGSIFVSAQFLWWSDNFNIVGPATVYSWGAAGPRGPDAQPYVGTSYNNGTSSKWVVQVQYYKATDYDGNVWNAAASSGPAISDIYPWTEVSGAAAYNGADLFYTDDNTSLPPADGLVISGAHLDASTNRFSAIAAPHDAADYEIASPEAVTLPDGSLYVIWSALPTSEAYVDSPLNLTSIELQGAQFFPNTDTWGPVRTFSAGGFAQSYQIDATGTSGEVLELTAQQPLLTNKAPERLVEYNLAGTVLANVSTSGLSEVVSLRGASNLAVVDSLGGNYSLLSLPSGSSVAIAYTPAAGSNLISATFAQGSSTSLVLLYRSATASELVLYDTAGGSTLASLALGADALQAEAITGPSATYVFDRTVAGLDGWSESAGTFSNLTTVALPGVVTYGLVQAGSSIVVYAIAPTGGNSTEPIRELALTEIGASLPEVPVPSAVKTSGSSAAPPDYALYLGIAAGAAGALLAGVAIMTRRHPPTASSSAPPAGATSPSSPGEPAGGSSTGGPPTGPPGG
ncbi:MAG TPA: kelch repeat-containing protein [Thermoplasmata archaeon]|nr:kelch repeat-containing protein [Thermoplasmata archaeon]